MQAAILSQENLTSELLRGIAETVSLRAGETEAVRSIRQQTAIFSVMGFLPRDAVEIIVAGQCVVFNHLLADGARDLLRGQAEAMKLKTRPQLTAAGNVFLKSLAELSRLHLRPIDQIAVLPVGQRFEAIKAEAKKPAPPVMHQPAATVMHAPAAPVTHEPAPPVTQEPAASVRPPVAPPPAVTVTREPATSVRPPAAPPPAAPVTQEPAASVRPPAAPPPAAAAVEPPPPPPVPPGEARNPDNPDPRIARLEEMLPKFALPPPQPPGLNPALMLPDGIGAVGDVEAEIMRHLAPPGTEKKR